MAGGFRIDDIASVIREQIDNYRPELEVAEVGRICFEIARQMVDRVVLVDETTIAKAVLRLRARLRSIQHDLVLE